MASESTYEFIEEKSETQEIIMDSMKEIHQRSLKLVEENEKYKQDIHTLQCKLNIYDAMRNEMQAANESLEQTAKYQQDLMSRKVQDIEEKHGAEKRDLFTRLSDMETDLIEKSNIIEDLKLKLKENEEFLQTMILPESIPTQHEESINSKDQIEEILEKLVQREETCKQLEENEIIARKEATELREILTLTKDLLSEKSELLESVKDELAECRIELDSLRNTPASDICKGNSLFAEVEDRRQKMLDNMSAMKKGYYEAKRVVQSKDAEIKSLKAELSAILRKFEDDTVDTIQQNGNLSNKYKARISELELKLRNQQKKIKQLEEKDEPTNKDFNFFQSLVDSKKKEIEELENQLENVSLQAILEEETKHQMGRQLRYWRWKAMSTEAQLVFIKAHLESNSDPSNSELLKILQDNFSKHSKFEETLDSSHQISPISDKNVYKPDDSILPTISIPKIRSFAVDDEIKTNKIKEETIWLSENSNMLERKSEEIMILKEVNPFGNARPMMTETKEVKSNEETLKENILPKLKSALKEFPEKEKKTLRFTKDTVDPEPKLLGRQFTPKYPIIYISGKKGT